MGWGIFNQESFAWETAHMGIPNRLWGDKDVGVPAKGCRKSENGVFLRLYMNMDGILRRDGLNRKLISCIIILFSATYG